MFGTRLPGIVLAALVLAALAAAGSVAFAATGRPAEATLSPRAQRRHGQGRSQAGIAKLVTPRVEAELKKLLEHHPQLIAKLDAPDPKVDADAYRNFLSKSHIAGAYDVTVEITVAAEELTPLPDKPGAQRLELRLVLNMTGKKIPDGTLGFGGTWQGDDPAGSRRQAAGQRARGNLGSGGGGRHLSRAEERAPAAGCSTETETKPKPKPKPKPSPSGRALGPTSAG